MVVVNIVVVVVVVVAFLRVQMRFASDFTSVSSAPPRASCFERKKKTQPSTRDRKEA